MSDYNELIKRYDLTKEEIEAVICYVKSLVGIGIEIINQ